MNNLALTLTTSQRALIAWLFTHGPSESWVIGNKCRCDARARLSEIQRKIPDHLKKFQVCIKTRNKNGDLIPLKTYRVWYVHRKGMSEIQRVNEYIYNKGGSIRLMEGPWHKTMDGTMVYDCYIEKGETNESN